MDRQKIIDDTILVTGVNTDGKVFEKGKLWMNQFDQIRVVVTALGLSFERSQLLYEKRS